MVYSGSRPTEREGERDRKRGACTRCAFMPDSGNGGDRMRAEREGAIERGRASESDKKGARNENDGRRERERERVYARIQGGIARGYDDTWCRVG